MVERWHELLRRSWGDPADAETTRIDLLVREDGGFSISGVDMGPKVEAMLGDCDHEYRLDVPPGQCERLLAAVLRHAITADAALTFAGLRDILRAEGIPFDEVDWT